MASLDIISVPTSYQIASFILLNKPKVCSKKKKKKKTAGIFTFEFKRDKKS